MTLRLANFLISTVLPKVFIPGQRENMLKFGIFLIDDMVEYLGYELLNAHWASFSTILVTYTNEKSCVLRQAACYGLGVFAERTPNNVLNGEAILVWTNALIESIKIPKGSEKEKTFGHCRDNGVAAIGKIIKAHSNLFDPIPYIAVWIRFLPLKFDKDEGMIQNELLVIIQWLRLISCSSSLTSLWALIRSPTFKRSWTSMAK